MKKMMCISTNVIIGLIFLSCETKINPALQEAVPTLAVDACVSNRPGNQTIILIKTQAYFDNSLPLAVSGAVVTIIDNLNNVFVFEEDSAKPGHYVWKPVGTEVFGAIGNTYKLVVTAEGEKYEASSRMGRVPVIDSITFKKNEPTQPNPDFYRGEFWATDPQGSGDAYWIRTTKNGIFSNKPSEINIAYDAGFAPGGNIDGITFIPPIRGRINPNEKDATGKVLSPYVPGDSAFVEINSITVAAFDYLNEVSIQTNRPGGFSELFARPIANVSTNIVNPNPNGKKAVGFFNVAAVSSLGKKFKK